MPRLTPTNWQTQVAIFEADGFGIARIKGSHIVMSKPRVIRPVIIPKYSDVGLDIVRRICVPRE
ncbi:MAG: type II toxin-antitoxin system HicA family toxin, partial [Candidatus Marinimicrobia bacterium]|nr:type II toxin-antitoxin system HicA family toxin [Candidatus Neomarinimicrobiota bacterium]